MNAQKLYPIDLVRLHHAEAGQFINRFFEDVAQATLNLSVDEDLEGLYQKINEQRPVFQKALDQIRAQQETEQIALLDQNRDHDIQALRFALKAYRTSRNTDKQKAYTELSIILTQYKDVEDDNYEQETIRLTNLVSLLTDSSHTAAVSLLKLNEFVTELASSNTAFNTLFANRSYQVSAKTVYDVKALRKELFTDYKLLADYVLSMAKVKATTPLYKDVLTLLNNGRQYYANTIARRTSGNVPTDTPAEGL